MKHKIKLRAIGHSVGVVLPREALGRLGLEKGDTLFLEEGRDGITLTPCTPDFAEQMKCAHDIMKRYRNALHELAK